MSVTGYENEEESHNVFQEFFENFEEMNVRSSIQMLYCDVSLV